MKEARYLGVIMGKKGEAWTEVRKRVAAMKRAWCEAGKIWFEKVPYRFMRLMITAFLVNTVLSGLTLAILSTRQFKHMEKGLVKLLRAAMRGKAAWSEEKEGKEVTRSLTNHQVLKYWRLAPLEVEARVRRFKQYQTWAAAPEHHTQALAAVFGTTRLDEKHNRQRLTEGRINEASTPWAKQFERDIKEVQDKDFFSEVTYSTAEDMLKIFKDRETAEQFMLIDFTQLRAEAWSRKNTGAEGQSDSGSSSEEQGDEQIFHCGYENEKGESCEAKFASERARRMHVRQKHSYRSEVYQLIIANECPFCCSTFKIRENAAKHVLEATKGGTCKTDLSVWCPLLLAPKTAECIICQKSFETWDEYRWHVREHLAPPEEIELTAEDPEAIKAQVKRVQEQTINKRAYGKLEEKKKRSKKGGNNPRRRRKQEGNRESSKDGRQTGGRGGEKKRRGSGSGGQRGGSPHTAGKRTATLAPADTRSRGGIVGYIQVQQRQDAGVLKGGGRRGKGLQPRSGETGKGKRKGAQAKDHAYTHESAGGTGSTAPDGSRKKRPPDEAARGGGSKWPEVRFIAAETAGQSSGGEAQRGGDERQEERRRAQEERRRHDFDDPETARPEEEEEAKHEEDDLGCDPWPEGPPDL